MSSEKEERIYHSVERAVLWGEPREEVFQMMETNGITGPEAEALFGRARAERISIIRADALRIVVKGLVPLCLAGGIILYCWYGLGVMPRFVFVFGGLGVLWGMWLTVDGLVKMALASEKEGSVVEES